MSQPALFDWVPLFPVALDELGKVIARSGQFSTDVAATALQSGDVPLRYRSHVEPPLGYRVIKIPPRAAVTIDATLEVVSIREPVGQDLRIGHQRDLMVSGAEVQLQPLLEFVRSNLLPPDAPGTGEPDAERARPPRVAVSRAELERWYRARIAECEATGEAPSEAADWAAAREA